MEQPTELGSYLAIQISGQTVEIPAPAPIGAQYEREAFGSEPEQLDFIGVRNPIAGIVEQCQREVMAWSMWISFV